MYPRLTDPYDASARLPARALPGRVLALALLVMTAPTLARADAQAGATIAQKGGGGGVIACMTCHGAQGEGQAAAGFPRLAGQPRAYIEKQLKDFASGKRENPQMAPIAKQLKPDQIANLADYYSGLPDWKPAAGAAAPASDAKAYALGRSLATRGKWSEGVPACFSCHAEGGTGVPPHFPAIAGQPRAYTEAQLKGWQTSHRHNDPQGLMKTVAEQLSAEEIAAVSLYLEHPVVAGKDK